MNGPSNTTLILVGVASMAGVYYYMSKSTGMKANVPLVSRLNRDGVIAHFGSQSYNCFQNPLLCAQYGWNNDSDFQWKAPDY